MQKINSTAADLCSNKVDETLASQPTIFIYLSSLIEIVMFSRWIVDYAVW